MTKWFEDMKKKCKLSQDWWTKLLFFAKVKESQESQGKYQKGERRVRKKHEKKDEVHEMSHSKRILGYIKIIYDTEWNQS